MEVAGLLIKMLSREKNWCSEMDVNDRIIRLGIKLLNQSNYKVWKTHMESYLVGEYSWEVVRGADVTMPENNAENAEAIKQWKQRNAKAEFVLKRFISLALFDHIIHCKLACEIWQTMDRLFNKKDMAHL